VRQPVTKEQFEESLERLVQLKTGKLSTLSRQAAKLTMERLWTELTVLRQQVSEWVCPSCRITLTRAPYDTTEAVCSECGDPMSSLLDLQNQAIKWRSEQVQAEMDGMKLELAKNLDLSL
jgi:predicted amidophosphoribosyltransferase